MEHFVKQLGIAINGSLKLLLRLKLPHTSDFIKNSDSIVILGNGPSLNTIMEKLEQLKRMDFLAVNYFACTEPFERLKPSSYAIASPQFWMHDKQEEWTSTRYKIFECLISKVNWPMNLFVPVIAKKDHNWQKRMAINSNIKIQYINLSPIDGNPKYFHYFLKNFLVCPRPHNVLVPSVLVSINLKYKNIYLAGADHSWIPEISVNAKNDVLIAQKHFYGSENKNHSLLSDKARPMYSAGSEIKFKLHDVLMKFYFSFKSYWILKEYAQKFDVNIYNLLLDSYIDAFEKINIDDITS